MRAIVNRYHVPPAGPRVPGPDARAFHRTLPGYAPTPLVRRTDLAGALGLADLYVKYEGPRFGLGAFKGLGASWALHRLQALRSGQLGTISTASEGNHGRAVAWSARLAGIPCVIFLPRHAAPERIENIRREGARVVLVDGTYEDAVRRCAVESEREGWQIISDVGYEGYLEIPPLVVEGYSTLYEEVDEAIAARGWAAPDVVLIPGGVGGILHAGVDHYRRHRPVPAIVAVEPAEGDCLTESIGSPGGEPAVSRGSRETGMACLNCAEVSLPSWPAIRAGVDVFLAIDDRWAEEGVRRLHRAGPGATPIDAGASGAASTGGLIALVEAPELRSARSHLGLGPWTVALCICTEGPIDRAAFDRIVGAAA